MYKHKKLYSIFLRLNKQDLFHYSAWNVLLSTNLPQETQKIADVTAKKNTTDS